MSNDNQSEKDVVQFILDEIDSVPHLEALLLLWNSRPQVWSASHLAKRVYVTFEVARKLLEDLSRQHLVSAAQDSPEHYRYEADSGEKDRLMEAVDTAYRHQLISISTLIHVKPSSAVRQFAGAFRLTKERE